MQPVAHILEYYRTKLAWADAADWPHVHLRERVRHYETVNARRSLRDEDAANKLLETGEIADLEEHIRRSTDADLEDSEHADVEAWNRLNETNDHKPQLVADISELGIARTKKILKLSGGMKIIKTAPKQTDIEQMLDDNYELKEQLRAYVLTAIDDFAEDKLGSGERKGWQDSDLQNLFKALDTHLETILKRHGGRK